MRIDEYREQLVSVNAAIKAIEGGAQEYKIGTRSVRRGELATLYAERHRLEALIDSAYGSTTVGVMRRR